MYFFVRFARNVFMSLRGLKPTLPNESVLWTVFYFYRVETRPICYTLNTKQVKFQNCLILENDLQKFTISLKILVIIELLNLPQVFDIIKNNKGVNYGYIFIK